MRLVAPDSRPNRGPAPGGADHTSATARRRALAAIAVSQLLALTVWFSASAVAPQLQDAWSLDGGQLAALTLAVQLGFVVGALGAAMTNLADRVASRTLFVASAIAAAAVNASLVVVGSNQVWLAIVLRFVSGVALAGVYPSGLKVMAGWFERERGMALGVLVGALTVGSATPHLVRGIVAEWRVVVMASSVMALLAAVVMARFVGDGPHDSSAARFSFRQVGQVVRSRGYRLSTFGYLGHMWELYAMWTWTAAFLAASGAAAGTAYGPIGVWTFFIIAVGGFGAWRAGVWADRYGRPQIAGGSMIVSGSCAAVTPLLFGRPAWLVVPVFIVWGFAVVADSAQFSTMATETSAAEARGTALALQTALGFLLTLVTIRGVPLIAESFTWRWAFPVLALGPVLGVAAMARMRKLNPQP